MVASDARNKGLQIVNALQRLQDEAVRDPAVGIRIATVLDTAEWSWHVTELAPKQAVAPHYHRHGDEIYFVLAGSGLIHTWPADQTEASAASQRVEACATFVIAPHTVHRLENTETEPLILLFACSPSHLTNDRTVVTSHKVS